MIVKIIFPVLFGFSCLISNSVCNPHHGHPKIWVEGGEGRNYVHNLAQHVTQKTSSQINIQSFFTGKGNKYPGGNYKHQFRVISGCKKAGKQKFTGGWKAAEVPLTETSRIQKTQSPRIHLGVSFVLEEYSAILPRFSNLRDGVANNLGQVWLFWTNLMTSGISPGCSSHCCEFGLKNVGRLIEALVFW